MLCFRSGRPVNVVAAGVLAAVTLLALAACAPADAPTIAAPSTTRSTNAGTAGTTWTLPPANGRFDYQIGGDYTPDSRVDIVDRDRSSTPARGVYNVCYVNAFQTQPEEADFWTHKHPDLLLTKENGKRFTDPDWPGEYLLDTSTAAKRASIAAIVGGWIDGCKKSGFDAVEPDNLDTWTRSGGLLTKADNIAYATLLAARAHSDGLAIAQKNAAELGSVGKSTVKFDFAIAEECQVYTECGAYTRVYGDHVIEIEYTDNARSAFTEACAAQGKRISVILRDRDVVAKGKPAYRYDDC